MSASGCPRNLLFFVERIGGDSDNLDRPLRGIGFHPVRRSTKGEHDKIVR
jgi:hypothetical protein